MSIRTNIRRMVIKRVTEEVGVDELRKGFKIFLLVSYFQIVLGVS